MKSIRSFVASASEIKTGEVYGLRALTTWLALRVLALSRTMRDFLQGVVLLLIRLRASLDQSIESFENIMLNLNSDSSLFPGVARRPLPSEDCLRASKFTDGMTQSAREWWAIGYLDCLCCWRCDLQWESVTTSQRVSAMVEAACLEPSRRDMNLPVLAAQVVAGLVRQRTPDEGENGE